MEPLARQLVGRQELLESLGDTYSVAGPSEPIPKDEVPLVIAPSIGRCGAFDKLASSMPLQGIYHGTWQRDGAVAGHRFWLNKDVVALEPLQGLPYADGAALEIDVPPRQSENLALAKPGAECHEKERLISICLDDFEKPSRGGLVERLDLPADDPRCVDQLGDVPSNDSPAFGLGQGLPEDGTNDRHRTGRGATRGLRIQEGLDVLGREPR
jgi:hypothetical protein